MPPVHQPSRTWVIGTHPMYAFDNGQQREHFWTAKDREEANLVFLDGHVEVRIEVAGQEPTTDAYTFLPQPDWLSRLSSLGLRAP